MQGDCPRILLLMTPTTYRATDFLGAGARAGVEIVVGTNRAQTLAGLAPDHNLTLPFDDHAAAESIALAYAARCPVQAVVGVDDEAVLPAARLAAALGVPHNTVESVAATRSKIVMREHLAAAGLSGPAARSFSPRPRSLARGLRNCRRSGPPECARVMCCRGSR